MRAILLLLFSRLVVFNSAAFIELRFNAYHKTQYLSTSISCFKTKCILNMECSVSTSSLYLLTSYGRRNVRGPRFTSPTTFHRDLLSPLPRTIVFSGDPEESLSDNEILIPQGDWREARARYVSFCSRAHPSREHGNKADIGPVQIVSHACHRVVKFDCWRPHLPRAGRGRCSKRLLGTPPLRSGARLRPPRIHRTPDTPIFQVHSKCPRGSAKTRERNKKCAAKYADKEIFKVKET
jgi:hypothetical protein